MAVSSLGFSAFIWTSFPISWIGVLLFSIVLVGSGWIRISFVKAKSGFIHRDIHFSLSFLSFYFFGLGTSLVVAWMYAALLIVLRWNDRNDTDARVPTLFSNTFLSVLTQMVLFSSFAWTLDSTGMIPETTASWMVFWILLVAAVTTEVLQTLVITYTRLLFLERLWGN